MEQYAITISQNILGSHDEQLLFCKPLNSKSHQEKLEKKLVTNDTKRSRYACYFPKTNEALKIQNRVLRIFKTIITFFFDLVSLPFNYKSYAKNLKENIPVYKYLQSKGVSNTHLSKELPKNIYFKKLNYASGNFSTTENKRSIGTTLFNYTKSSSDGFEYSGPNHHSYYQDEIGLYTRRFVKV